MKKKTNKKLQPLIVIIGDCEEIICCVYDLRWKLENVLAAFDVLFKCFFTFDLEFPYQSIVQYKTLQYFVYEIISKTIHPKARTVVADLKRIAD